MFDQFLSKAGEMLASGQSFAIAEVVRHLTPDLGQSRRSRRSSPPTVRFGAGLAAVAPNRRLSKKR